ncbi:MAG: hypothetical protein ACRDKT_14740 [Actinomycetota bacterium]
MIECPTCHNQVPEGTYCVVCGSRLGEGAGARRKEFSAAPGQSVLRPAPMSTIFPQLPNDEMRNFYTALGIGVAVMVALAAFGFFPLALVAAAVLIPIITVVYVYDVDVYEDEPIRIIGLTMLAGAIAGAVYGALTRVLAPVDAASLMDPSTTDALIRVVVLPIVGIALTLIGPIFLLRYRRFNDVLDGATFGVAAAVSFAGAALLVQAWPYFAVGLRPGGDVGGWIFRLLNLGILLPLLYAGATGVVGGALWLQYRAPVRDRDALGPLGKPPVALFFAVVALVLGALALEIAPEWLAFIWLLLLDVAVIIGLRLVIHLGLMQEAAERDIGSPITCPNCQHQTPLHTFCSNCGISLQALPKAGAASIDRKATTT